MKFNNVFEISKKHFLNWSEIMSRIFNLSNKEVELLAKLLEYYNRIINTSKCDEKTANTLLFSTEYRRMIKSDMNIKDNYFDVLINKLKSHKAILVEGDYDNRRIFLNERIIPKIAPNGMFTCLFVFSPNDVQQDEEKGK